MAELQVRRPPVLNRDKRLIGIVSLGDLAIQRSEEHTSELQSHHDLVCRLLLEKKKEIGRFTDLYPAGFLRAETDRCCCSSWLQKAGDQYANRVGRSLPDLAGRPGQPSCFCGGP